MQESDTAHMMVLNIVCLDGKGNNESISQCSHCTIWNIKEGNGE